MNLKLVMLCGIVFFAISCNNSKDASPDIIKNVQNNNSITSKITGSWTPDLEAIKNNSPQELHKNIDMLSMMGVDLFKVDIKGDGEIIESGLGGGLSSIGKWTNEGNIIKVTFEPNEMQKEALNSKVDYLTAEVKAQLQREFRLVGSNLIFEYDVGPQTLTLYLKK